VTPRDRVTGTSGKDGPEDGQPRAMPEWSDHEAWRELYRRASRPTQQRMVFHAWAAAAGGQFVEADGDPLLVLPPDLPDCPAKVELHRIADDWTAM
jgi:hypothetical protein